MDRELDRLTWTDLDGERDVALVVPIGSTEQHGPHLPLGTDTLVAVAAARAAIALLPAGGGRRWLLSPAIPYGSSGEHEAFPGTVSIGADALELLLLEYGRSACRWAAAVVFVNGHGGNTVTGRSAVRRLVAEGRQALWLDCALAGADAHAGATETGLVRHLDPALVREERVAGGVDTPIGDLMPALRRDGVRPVSPTGVLGDPRRAGPGDGHRDLARIAERLAAELAAGMAALAAGTTA